MLRHIAVILIILAALFAPIATAQKRTDIPKLPLCDAKQNAKWQTLQSDLAGVDTSDPDNPTIGRYSSGRFGFAGLYLFPYNWLPLSEKKQTMCGRFARFDWNSHSNEQDWNLRVIPSKLFSGMFADAKQYVSNQDDVWDCDPTPGEDEQRHQCELEKQSMEPPSPGNYAGKQPPKGLHNCFEAEVTPTKNDIQTWWFHRGSTSADESCSRIVDNEVCVYGPFVTEAVHGNRPEIHPLEAIWWRTTRDAKPGSSAAQNWTLLHLQDASNRYPNLSDFSPSPPRGWVPWAKSSRKAEFRIAIEVPSEPAAPLIFNAHEIHAEKVPDIDPGSSETTYIASYEGRDILQFAEEPPGKSHYQVGFEGLCTTPDANVRIFLVLKSTIGIQKKGDQVEAGFHAIQVRNAVNPVPLAPIATKPDVAPLGIVPSSIHAVSVEGRVKLFGQLGSAEKESGSMLLQQQPSQSKPISVESMLPSGEKVVLLQRVLTASQTSEPSLSAGELLAGYLGISSVPETLVEHVSDTEFTAALQYAVTREGKPAWEDSETLVGDINKKLAEAGRAGQVSLLGNKDPHSEWTFQGWACGEKPDWGCKNRTSVPVVKARRPMPQSDFIYVDENLEGPIPRFHVYFPKGIYKDTLLLLVATGNVKDPDSDLVKKTAIQFYNIAIPVKDDSDDEAERIVAGIAKLIGVPIEKLSGGVTPEVLVSFAQVARYRQAEMLRLNIKHAAEGGVITPETMNVFVRAAQRLAELP